MTPRAYQQEAIDSVLDAFRRGVKRVVIAHATGLGKAVEFSYLAKYASDRGWPVLILVDRDNLCKQAANHLWNVCKRIPSIEKGQEKGSLTSKVVVGSVQTLQGERLAAWPKGHFRLILVDECHKSTSSEFRAILSHFADAYYVGFTATVERHDKQGIFFHFEEIVHEMPIIERSDIVVRTGSESKRFAHVRDAEKYIDKLPVSLALSARIEEQVIPGGIDQGWLVPLKFHQLPVPVTIDETLASKTNLTEEEESFALEPYLKKLAIALKDNIGNRKTLVFLPDCESSMAFAQILRDLGVKADHVEGVGQRKVYEKDADGKCVRDTKGERIVKTTRTFKQEEYDGVIARWKSGEIQVVTNATILYIGFDYPEIDCVVMLRLIRSTPMIMQCMGRGTRTVKDELGYGVDDFKTAEERKAFIASSPKPNCLILDMLLQMDDHNFSSPPDIIADYREKKAKTEATPKNNMPVDLEEMSQNFRKSRLTELEEKLRKVAEKVANQARKKGKESQLFLADILKSPTRGFEIPATSKQMDYIHALLRKSGKEFPAEVDTAKLTKNQASRIIARLLPKERAK